jgi:predicted phosphohydrolase
MPRLFAIADLHLSFARPKPMDVFDEAWRHHPEQIESAWRERVGPDDVVLVAGDISWAMRLPEVQPDLAWLDALPGRKVLIRGNHDYWWGAIGKLRALPFESLHFLQYDVVRFGDLAIAGTRLWELPEVRWPQEYTPLPDDVRPGKAVSDSQSAKLVARELGRLELSLGRLPDDVAHRVAMLHYPPVSSDGRGSRVSAMLAGRGIELCAFGHLHSLGRMPRPGADCVLDGTRYVLVAGDWLGFAPVELMNFED